MAKKAGETPAPSWADFEEDNLLNNEIEDEDEEQEDEEEEEEEPPVKKKKKVTPKPEEEEEEEEGEEEEEEEEPQKPIKKKEPVKPAPAEEEEEEENPQPDLETAAKFFEEVDKLTGNETEVDYGDVDPLSPQGVALREKAIKEAALDTWLAEMQENYPQVYKALLHANNGGDVADLFKQTTERDYSKVVINEGDTDLAKEILRDYYRSKGVKNEAKISKLIEADEDSEGGLVAEGQAALQEMQAEQAEAQNQILENQKKAAEEQKKRDTVFLTAVDEVLDSRKLGSFKIQDKIEANKFRQFVVSNLRRSGDKYEIVSQVDEKKLEKILQFEYFKFKGGDLGSIIQQKATSTNTEKLRLRVKGESQRTTTKGGSGGGGTNLLTFEDFE